MKVLTIKIKAFTFILVKYPILVRLYKFVAKDEIEEALINAMSTGKFRDEQEFIDHLIRNYYVESRFYDLRVGDSENDWEKPLTYVDAKMERRLKRMVEEQGTHTVNANLLKSLSQDEIYQQHHNAGLIYYWQNRILPIKFVLAVLGALMVSKGNALVTLDELKKAVISDADGFVKKNSTSYASTEHFEKKKFKDILVGFPMSVTPLPWDKKDMKHNRTQVLRSRERFCEQFLGRYMKAKKRNIEGMAGACFEMGLLVAYEQMINDEHGPKIFIMLTKLGLELLCIENPMLSSIYDNKSFPKKMFSEKEREFFMDNILPRFELENGVVSEFFNLQSKLDRQEHKTKDLLKIFKEKQRTFLEKLWEAEIFAETEIKVKSFTYEKKATEELESEHNREVDEYRDVLVRIDFDRSGIPKKNRDAIIETIDSYWQNAIAYQRIHLVVMLSRLAELGLCNKSATRPAIYNFNSREL
jgi:hypothetical protein